MNEINPIRLNAVPSANPGPTGAKRSTKFSEVIQGLRGSYLGRYNRVRLVIVTFRLIFSPHLPLHPTLKFKYFYYSLIIFSQT
jgi:hypothetical protein